MKYEICANVMTKFIQFRGNIYSYLIDDGSGVVKKK